MRSRPPPAPDPAVESPAPPHALDTLSTPRLTLRRLDEADAPFILELLNDPDWLRHIGDRGVRTLDDARGYINDGPLAMHARYGFGLDAVTLRGDGTPIGLCGLLRREELEDPDLGFAFLPAHRGRGLAREAALATLAHAAQALGLRRIVAITAPGNAASIRLLESLGFRFERTLRLHDDAEELRLYGYAAPSP